MLPYFRTQLTSSHPVSKTMVPCSNIVKIFTNKILRSKVLTVCVMITLSITLILILIIHYNDCDCATSIGSADPNRYNLAADSNNLYAAANRQSADLVNKYKDDHVLCLIIPFRDRFDELLIFLMHMKMFLQKQNIRYYIYVLNQIDSYRFNRGSLINVGFLYIRDNTKCDFIVMHDVDLIPINFRLDYSYPGDAIMHIAAPHLHPKYHYKTFLGGILIMKNEHFELVNGLSNKYWGWGLEDDELYVRIKEAQLKIKRPQNLTTGIDNTFRHFHDKSRRRRDMVKCYNQKEITRRRDRETGLHNVEYEIPSNYVVNVNDSTAIVLNVILYCNTTVTPWCLCKTSGGGKSAPR